jgi:putative toxin-antitoxin system, antitoxin component
LRCSANISALKLPATVWSGWDFLVLLIEEAINLIEKNSSHIKSAQDFLYSSDGMFTLSGICMQLIFIGESVKVLDAKTEHDYLLKYPME